MKRTILILLSFCGNIFCQIHFAEIHLTNKYTAPVNIFITPEGSVFSGRGVATNAPDNRYRYTFLRSRYTAFPLGWEYIVGAIENNLNIPVNEFRLVDFDDGDYNPSNSQRMLGGIGYGLWKMVFTSAPNEINEPIILAECFLDYRDYNFGYAGGGFDNDLYFELRHEANQNKLYFRFASCSTWVDIEDIRIENHTIKIWQQICGDITRNYPGSPNKGDYKSSNLDNGNYLNFPLFATNYGALVHNSPNECGMNFSIVSGHHANILPGQIFTITNYSTFSLL